MEKAAFEAELKSTGHTHIEDRALDPRPTNARHAHDYDIRGLVMEGTFIIWRNDQPVRYGAGQIFAVPAGTEHSEEIGPDGARVVVGRKVHSGAK